MSNPNVDYPWEYVHCTANTLVSPRRCVLHAICVNHSDAADVDLIVYDNTAAAGTIIAIIDINNSTHYVIPDTLFYDIQCTTGIYVAFGGQPSTADITVMYK